jgi:TolB protein
MPLFICLFLVSLCSLWAEEIVVPLGTVNPLQPVYLVPWLAADGSSLEAAHLQELKAVLQFDLGYNSFTSVAAETEARRALARTEGTHRFEANKWRALGVFYVIRAAIEERCLYLRIDSVSKNNAVSYAIDLTGNLSSDRRQIHRLADTIQEDLFGEKGISATQILYTLRRKVGSEQWRSELWIADSDGANAHSLGTGDGYCVTPSFVPAEKGHVADAFLYVSYRLGQPKVYASSIQGGGAKRLLQLRGNQLMPVASPRGDQLAFISDAAGNPDLFIQGFDAASGAVGKPRQIFTAKAATQASPAFSPDGSQLAFVSNKDGAARIYVMAVPKEDQRADSITPCLISRRCRENTSPSWSPDGKYIAYSAMTEETRQIWIYDVEANQEHQLTEGAGHKENPSWAPDSRHLVFNLLSGESSELCLTHLAGKEIVRISFGPGEKRFPCWAPSS